MSDTHEAPANEASEDVMNHDSTDAAQAGTPGTVPASATDATNADIASMGYEQAPVSYTHLTLPTILRV